LFPSGFPIKALPAFPISPLILNRAVASIPESNMLSITA
jgi:hypothetical protein